MKLKITTVLFLMLTFSIASQEDNDNEQSNIITYTPSKLLNKGQWDIKWFNNIYTQTKNSEKPGSQPRETYFTSTIDIFTGISKNNNLDVGLLLEIRSNAVNGLDTFDVFKFENNSTNGTRSGFTSFAPAIKFKPFNKISNLTLLTAFHIPLVKEESENNVYLDQKGYTLQNRFLYDYTFAGDELQLFAEINTEYNFGDKKESFANTSLVLTPSVFFSYFPSQKFTVLVMAQHSQRLDLGESLAQDYSVLGFGTKYQLTKVLNIEFLYTNFVRGNNTGLGQTFNIGLRTLF
ncbi:hypothetical protein FORMB_04290 [Formosa sp. Hel1_33_131]|uniref:hypothetical protein n=1 Tax=Formosa sp. Hel1_33_131 TaxID=1336794 RepID=UPI00084E10FB|nr:hypothetical protein [Formosa sp. Hel1_33_131]AOR27490.1 hypothetical protein FORMB_04290 [Formosa sp. Hel1_33_131]